LTGGGGGSGDYHQCPQLIDLFDPEPEDIFVDVIVPGNFQADVRDF